MGPVAQEGLCFCMHVCVVLLLLGTAFSVSSKGEAACASHTADGVGSAIKTQAEQQQQFYFVFQDHNDCTSTTQQCL